MIIKEKENDINHFNSAKKYFDSSPSDYINSLEELNQISLLKQNLTVMHMKVLCLLMLSKYEEIIECYYTNKKYFDSIFIADDNNEEKNEIKKIISLGFFNFNYKKKAKIICPDIKEEYDYKIEKSEIKILKEEANKSFESVETLKINKKKTFSNIKHELDKNMKIINKNKSKELMRLSSDFVDDLFSKAKNNCSKKNLYQLGKSDINLEKNGDKNSSNSDIYLKLKNDISDIDNIQKEDGNLITFEEKIKDVLNFEKNEEKEKNNENNIINKLINEDSINNKPKEDSEEVKNTLNTDNNTNDHNEINIYNNANTNNNTNNNVDKEKPKKSRNITKELPRKSCNVFSFVNPIEFTLSPGNASFCNYSNTSEHGEEDENKITNNKNLIKVEVDDVQYCFVKNENYNNNEVKDNYEEYINVDFTEFRNKNKKKTTKIKYSKSLKINLDRDKYKNLEDFAKMERKIVFNMRQVKGKKTSVYKTSFNLDNK